MTSKTPPGWAWTTLCELLRVRGGFAFKSKDYRTTGIPLIRQSDLGVNGDVCPDGAVRLPQEYVTLYPDFVVQKGDYLIGMSGSIGRLASYKGEGVALQNQRTGLLQFYDPAVRHYVVYQLSALENRLSSMGKGVAVQNISSAQIESSPICLPPLSEQRRIVAKIEELFSQLDAGVEELKKAKAQLKRYRQSVLKAAFEGELTEEWRRQRASSHEPRAPKDERLPAGWRWVRLGDVVAVASGNTPKGVCECIGAGEIPFYRVADMNSPGNEKHMRESAVGLSPREVARLKLKVQPVGTVIFPKRGGAIATNKVRVLSKPATYDLNIMGLCPLELPPEYVYYWLSGVKLVTLSDGSNVPQINHKDVEPLMFPLAPPTEQRVVVEEVEERLSVADAEEKAIEAALKQAARLRQSILKRAFEGRLVPQDPSDEPAERLLERIRAEKAKRAAGQPRGRGRRIATAGK